jgi:enoyl-CoA hydratase/carnithine racemase
VQVALACDCIVASDTAYLQTQGGSKGWFCFTPAVELVHALPKQAAFELLFAGVRLSATRAAEWGYIDLDKRKTIHV